MLFMINHDILVNVCMAKLIPTPTPTGLEKACNPYEAAVAREGVKLLPGHR